MHMETHTHTCSTAKSAAACAASSFCCLLISCALMCSSCMRSSRASTCVYACVRVFVCVRVCGCVWLCVCLLISCGVMCYSCRRSSFATFFHSHTQSSQKGQLTFSASVPSTLGLTIGSCPWLYCHMMRRVFNSSTSSSNSRMRAPACLYGIMHVACCVIIYACVCRVC